MTMAEVMKVIALVTMMICLCLMLHENVNKQVNGRPRKQN